MPHYAEFHLGLNCFLGQNRSSEQNNIFGNYNLLPQYTMNHPDFIVINMLLYGKSHWPEKV